MLPSALLVLAYLIGSIPFSYLVVRLVAGADIRQHGSRNVGATNVARNFGKVPGIVALLLDLAKGYAVIALARWMVALSAWPPAEDRKSTRLNSSHSQISYAVFCLKKKKNKMKDHK